MRLDLTQKSPTNSLLKSPPAKGCGRKVSNLGQNQGALALAQQHRPYPDGQGVSGRSRSTVCANSCATRTAALRPLSVSRKIASLLATGQ